LSGLDISFWQLGHFVIVIAYTLMLIQFKDFCPMECARIRTHTQHMHVYTIHWSIMIRIF